MMKRTNYILPLFLMILLMAGNMVQAQSWHLRIPDLGFGAPLHLQERTIMGRKLKLNRRGGRSFRIRGNDRHLSVAKMWMLTDELDLTEEQATKLFPRLKAHEKALEGLSESRRKLLKAFHAKVEDEKASARDTERFVDDLSKLEKQRIDAKAKFIKGMKDVLKPEQLAIFAVFEERSRGILRNRIMGSNVFIEFMELDDDD